MEFLQEFGMRLKQARVQRGMSQDELARLVGFKSRSSINKIELGKQTITREKAMEMSKVLHVSPAYLMGWTKDEELISKINKLSPDDRLHVEAMVDFLLQRSKGK